MPIQWLNQPTAPTESTSSAPNNPPNATSSVPTTPTSQPTSSSSINWLSPGQNMQASSPASTASPTPSVKPQDNVKFQMGDTAIKKDTTPTPESWLDQHPWLKTGLGLAEKGASLFIGGTAKAIATPLKSMEAGITGDFEPWNLPIAGEVKPFEGEKGAASTFISGENVNSEELETIKSGAKEQLATAGSAALEAAGGKIFEAAGKTIKGAVKMIPGSELASKFLAEKAGKVSEVMYSKALQPIKSALDQNIIPKFKSLGLWGTYEGMKKKAIAGMEKSGQAIDDYIESHADFKISIDKINDAVNTLKDQYLIKSPTTGKYVPASPSAQAIVEALDKLTNNAIEIADEAGEVMLGDLVKMKRAVGKALPKTSWGKGAAELTPVQQGEREFIDAVRDSFLENVPELSKVNSDYNKYKLASQALDRVSKLRGKQNVFPLMSWLSTIGGTSAGKPIEGVLLGTALAVAKTPLWRTALAKGAAGVEQLLIKGEGINPATAKNWAVPIYNYMRQKMEQENTQEEEENKPLNIPEDIQSEFGSNNANTQDILKEFE